MPTLRSLIAILTPKHADAQRCCGSLAHPHRDWLIIAVASLSILFLFGVFDLWMYVSIIENPTTDGTAVANLRGPSVAQLDEALSHASGLSAEHVQLLATSTVSVPDPSR